MICVLGVSGCAVKDATSSNSSLSPTTATGGNSAPSVAAFAELGDDVVSNGGQLLDQYAVQGNMTIPVTFPSTAQNVGFVLICSGELSWKVAVDEGRWATGSCGLGSGITGAEMPVDSSDQGGLVVNFMTASSDSVYLSFYWR